jgi:hypothetical protein
MENLNKHTVDFYQGISFLGSEVREGILEDNFVGYENRQFIHEGTFEFKKGGRVKKFVASKESPVTCIKYNLFGR